MLNISCALHLDWKRVGFSKCNGRDEVDLIPGLSWMSGNTQPQSSQLAEPLWTGYDLKSGQNLF